MQWGQGGPVGGDEALIVGQVTERSRSAMNAVGFAHWRRAARVSLRPQTTRVSITCASINSSFITAPEQIPFLLAHAAPHAVHLTCPQRERQAFWPDLAPCADFLCLRYLLQGRAGR